MNFGDQRRCDRVTYVTIELLRERKMPEQLPLLFALISIHHSPEIGH
jgi:hypothetical protein